MSSSTTRWSQLDSLSTRLENTMDTVCTGWSNLQTWLRIRTKSVSNWLYLILVATPYYRIEQVSSSCMTRLIRTTQPTVTTQTIPLQVHQSYKTPQSGYVRLLQTPTSANKLQDVTTIFRRKILMVTQATNIALQVLANPSYGLGRTSQQQIKVKLHGVLQQQV